MRKRGLPSPVADFVHKLQLVLKELRESNYWLRLLAAAKTIPSERLATSLNESNELIAILSKSVATSKSKARGVA